MVYEGQGVYYNPKLERVYIMRDNERFGKPMSRELIAMREAGVLPPQIADEQIVEASSIPNKQEIVTKLQEFYAAGAPEEA